jgi:tripartite-type tricarboxylate transporter receptor subunit TctC
MSRALWSKACAALALWLIYTCAAFSQTYPSRPIRLVVPQSPGGSTDQVARPLAKLLGDALGQSVVVDNRPGAGSVIGTDIVAKAAPDGYTLLAVAASFTISPALYKQLPFDVERDFAPVTMISAFPNILVVHPSLPVTSVAELFSYLRKNPGKANYSSSGIGTGTHLSMELLKHLAGIDMVHVPYKGGGPAMSDLLGGRIEMYVGVPSTVAAHVDAGKLRALATTGAKRSSTMPGVPTIAESGYPDFEATNWYAFVAPGKTPKDLLDFWNRELTKALNDPRVSAELAKHGLDPAPGTRDELAKYIERETEKWGKVVREAKITAE